MDDDHIDPEIEAYVKQLRADGWSDKVIAATLADGTDEASLADALQLVRNVAKGEPVSNRRTPERTVTTDEFAQACRGRTLQAFVRHHQEKSSPEARSLARR